MERRPTPIIIINAHNKRTFARLLPLKRNIFIKAEFVQILFFDKTNPNAIPMDNPKKISAMSKFAKNYPTKENCLILSLLYKSSSKISFYDCFLVLLCLIDVFFLLVL